MKRFLISAIAIIAMSTAMLAQITICDEPCAAADPSEVEFSTSLLPYSPTSFETMYLGTPVDQCITIQCPSAISLGVSIAVESIELKDVINVPEGLTYCVSTDFVNAEEYCTIRLQGTPTTAGTYNLKLRLYVNSSSMVASVINRLTDTDSGYSIGISFEVVDENAETQPTASFTTNPEASIDIASLDFTSKVRITQGATVNYNSTCVDAHHLAWTFDGGDITSSTEDFANVTYTTVGTYETMLIAYSENETASDTAVVTVLVNPSEENVITADFTTYPEATSGLLSQYIQIRQGETVTFTSASSENTDHIAWSFEGGDPESSSDSEVTVTYTEAGNFTATLTAYNDDETISSTKSISVRVEAYDPAAMVASFSTYPEPSSLIGISFISVEAGYTVTYTNTSANAHHIAWTFEGGEPSSSTDDEVTVTYFEPTGLLSQYTTTLVVYNEDETETDTATIRVRVTGTNPNDLDASFYTYPEATSILIASYVSIEAGQSVMFTNTSANADHIVWTFEGGDPETSTDDEVNVTYYAEGTYTARLIAYNADETESDSATMTIQVTTPVIVASFTTVPETTSLVTDTFVSIEAGQSIVFTNTSTNADHIVWSFLGGDPATSTDDEVTVTYTTIGSYTARLDAYNADETVSDNTSIVVLVTTPTSISDSESEEINVYPNPTSSILNIVANGMQNIAIIDMNGREVLSRNVNGNSESINIENLAKAQYIVRITTDNGTILRNVIVE